MRGLPPLTQASQANGRPVNGTAITELLLSKEFLREKKYNIGKVVARGGMGAIPGTLRSKGWAASMQGSMTPQPQNSGANRKRLGVLQIRPACDTQ